MAIVNKLREENINFHHFLGPNFFKILTQIMRLYNPHVLLLISILFLSCTKTGGVSVPISQGNHKHIIVSSSSLLHQLQDNDRTDHPPSDNSYDDGLTASNNTTLTTSLILDHLIHDHHGTDSILGRVQKPVVVADELDAASKYLRHEAEGGTENGVSSDLTRVLDSFVINNYYNAFERPGRESGRPLVVLVDVEVLWITVDEQRNEVTATVTVTQNWTDVRLAYKDVLLHPDAFDFVTLTNDGHVVEMWLPDNVFVNEKRSSKQDVAPVRVTPDGQISREQRMTVTVYCEALSENHRFPFDSPSCSLELATFSWTDDQVEYEWVDNWVDKCASRKHLLSVESNGFRVVGVSRIHHQLPQNRTGLAVEFQLQRVLTPYVTRIFLPLACFCGIAIAGMGIGASVGAAVSYFTFGLINLFMGVSYNGPHFSWGFFRNQVDAYYLFCVGTVLVTGIVNMLRLHCCDKTSCPPESYEMHQNEDAKNGGASRLWTESDHFIDDNDEEVGQLTGVWNRGVEGVKNLVIRVAVLLGGLCKRMNECAVRIVVGVLIAWNLYFWISNGRIL